MMNRIEREVSIEDRVREMCRMVADDEEPASVLSAGMNVPDSRNDLILLMRKRDEADGESRMIGSGRRPDFLGNTARLGF
jgi:hypothetical protein